MWHFFDRTFINQMFGYNVSLQVEFNSRSMKQGPSVKGAGKSLRDIDIDALALAECAHDRSSNAAWYWVTHAAAAATTGKVGARKRKRARGGERCKRMQRPARRRPHAGAACIFASAARVCERPLLLAALWWGGGGGAGGARTTARSFPSPVLCQTDDADATRDA